MAARPQAPVRRFRHSIGFKLLLASLSLLAIPVAGYLFLQESERFLRGAQEQNLLATARALASVIPGADPAFTGSARPGGRLPWRNLPIRELRYPPTLDGYRDDWEQLGADFTTYRQPDGRLSARVCVGRHQGVLYLFFDVHTQHRRYGRPGDRVELAFATPAGGLLRLEVRPEAPGGVMAHEVPDRRREAAAFRLRPRIRGGWQEHSAGYALELAVPAELVDRRFAFRITEAATGLQLGSARLSAKAQLGHLVITSDHLQQTLHKLLPPGMRARITDHEGIVLAQAGVLDDKAPLDADQGALPWFLRQLLLALLPGQKDPTRPGAAGQARLDTPPVTEALAGRERTLRYRVEDRDFGQLSVASPIRDAAAVVGTLLLEQTTSEILSIQNLALQRLLLITLALFSFTSLVLLTFASLLSTRIRRLRNRLESVVSHDGRIVGHLQAARSGDEIGDLQRSFTRVLDRLRAYNQYLEGMASRLAHELRTPLSIVRTSLDNADRHDTSGDAVYLRRAREGAERLESIIQRLREASRLEQALQHADFAEIDLGELLARQIGGFESIYPGVEIEYRRPATPVRIRLAPDLICQALEKLLSNAVDFHEAGSAVRIELSGTNSEVVLATINRGPPMPREIDPFQSMTSLRDGNDAQPHLGLGLYLVSLIAAFHGGSVAAENRPGGEVAITLRLPLQAAGST